MGSVPKKLTFLAELKIVRLGEPLWVELRKFRVNGTPKWTFVELNFCGTELSWSRTRVNEVLY